MYQRQKGSFFKHFDFLILDFIVLEVAYALSHMIKHGVLNPFEDSNFLVMAGVLLLIQFMVVVFGEYYKDILRRGYLVELKKVIVQNTIVLVVTFSFMFITKLQPMYSRMVFVQLWGISIVLMYGERLIWKRLVRNKMRNSDERSRMLVISDENVLAQCIQQLKEKRYQSFKIIGAVAYDAQMKGSQVNDVPVVADWDEIFEYAKTQVVDEVFLNICVPEEIQKNITGRFLEMGIAVHINLNWNQSELPNKVVEKLGECSVLTTSIQTATTYQVFIKRAMDIVGGLIGLFFTGILSVFLGPIIYLQSPGPIFFSQIRVGRNGRKFRIYKFRSMYMDAEERKKELMSQNKMNGLMFKMDDDPRIFPAGKIIRKLSLDEFPQFWNVLKGDMSLVGTRPPTVDEFEQYEAHHKVRLAIKPGLTGMWQVSGRSNITDFEEVVKLDNKYIAEWNLRLDLKILCRTVAVVLGSEGSV